MRKDLAKLKPKQRDSFVYVNTGIHVKHEYAIIKYMQTGSDKSNKNAQLMLKIRATETGRGLTLYQIMQYNGHSRSVILVAIERARRRLPTGYNWTFFALSYS